MKKLILIFAVLIIGCESNPIIPTQTDAHKGVYASVNIFQEYGYCDSLGCYGESVLLYDRTITDWVTVAERFNTQDYIKIMNGIKYETTGYVLVYNTNTTCELEIIGTDIGICFTENGTLKIDLNYLTNYKILWGIQ